MKPTAPIDSLILTVRDQRVILSADLATIYGVETRALTQAVRRNADRFPPDFIFPLSADEFAEFKAQGLVTADGRAALRSQIVTLKRGQHAKFPPHAFTEHGAIMAAMVLNSPQAVTMSVYVVRAFAQMRGNSSRTQQSSSVSPKLIRRFSNTIGRCKSFGRNFNRFSRRRQFRPSHASVFASDLNVSEPHEQNALRPSSINPRSLFSADPVEPGRQPGRWQ